MAIPINLYPYTDLHEMNADYLLQQMQQLIAAWAETKGEWDETKLAWADTEEAWNDLKNYVEHYFENLDVQQEINNKIDAMILDGTFQQMLHDVIVAIGIDATPTENSTNLIESGGVWSALQPVKSVRTWTVDLPHGVTTTIDLGTNTRKGFIIATQRLNPSVGVHIYDYIILGNGWHNGTTGDCVYTELVQGTGFTVSAASGMFGIDIDNFGSQDAEAFIFEF